MLGTYALSSGYYDAYYRQAQKVRTLIAARLRHRLREVDLIVSPDLAHRRLRIGERTDDPLAMYLSDIYTIPVNLAGLPAISMPCGLSGHLPVGFQLMGPAFSENRLLAAAHALEGAIGFEAVPTFRDSRDPSTVPGGPGRRAGGKAERR